MADLVLRSSNLDNIVAGPLTARWNAAGTRILRYYIDVRHSKMNLHRELSAPERFTLQSKVDALLAAWDEKWGQYPIKTLLQSGKESADEMTADALQRLDSLGRSGHWVSDRSTTLRVRSHAEISSLCKDESSRFAIPRRPVKFSTVSSVARKLNILGSKPMTNWMVLQSVRIWLGHYLRFMPKTAPVSSRTLSRLLAGAPQPRFSFNSFLSFFAVVPR